MFQGLFDANAAFEAAAKALAPIARATNLAAKTFEKVVKFQAETAIDLVNHGAARVDALAEARSPLELAAKQTELTAKFVEARTAQWHEYLKFATDLKGDVTKLAEDAKTQFTAPLRQAA